VSGFRFPTPWSEIISGSATGPLRHLLDRWDVPLPIEDEPSSPDWISFAAVLIRNEVLCEVGLLDEGFFMYFEDADYCRRARRAGWEVWQEPTARIVHLRGRTSPVKLLAVARKRRPRYYYAARSRYFRNAWGSAGLLVANLGFTVGWAVARLRETVGNKQPHTVERQLADTWRG
jgi:GT2 family glycosyltransferase